MTKRQENYLYILFVTAILAIIVTNIDYVDMMIRIGLVFMCFGLTVEKEYGSERAYIAITILILLYFLFYDGYMYSISINESPLRECVDWLGFGAYVLILACLCLWQRRPKGKNKWLLLAIVCLIWTKLDILLYAIRRCLLNAELYNVPRRTLRLIINTLVCIYPLITLFEYEKNRTSKVDVMKKEELQDV